MVSIKFPSTQRSGSFVHSSSTPVVVAQDETLALNIPLCKNVRTEVLTLLVLYSVSSTLR